MIYPLMKDNVIKFGVAIYIHVHVLDQTSFSEERLGIIDPC